MQDDGAGAREPVRIPLWRVRDEASAPRYMSEGAAGCDLEACVEGPLTLAPLARALVPTGLAIALPPGFEAQVRPRSGLAIRAGVTVLNAPGTIDSDYRGEIRVALVNLGDQPYTIEAGERIAQLVVAPVRRAEWQIVADGTAYQTERGAGGFGHTGSTSVPGESPGAGAASRGRV